MMSPKRIARIVAAYARGERIIDISARIGVSGTHIYRALREAGIRRRRRFRPRGGLALRVHLAYVGGRTIAEVVAKTGLPRTFVVREIREAKEGLARVRKLESEKRRALQADHARLASENERLRTELERLRSTMPSNMRMG